MTKAKEETLTLDNTEVTLASDSLTTGDGSLSIDYEIPGSYLPTTMYYYVSAGSMKSSHHYHATLTVALYHKDGTVTYPVNNQTYMGNGNGTSGTVDISDCTRVVYSAGLWNGYRGASGSYTIKGKIQSWD